MKDVLQRNVHRLKELLKQKESGNPKFDLSNLSLMAQDMIDSIVDLKMHDDQHMCKEGNRDAPGRA